LREPSRLPSPSHLSVASPPPLDATPALNTPHQSSEKSTVTTVCLLISAMSAAITSTSKFYDIDVAPDKRKNNPKW